MRTFPLESLMLPRYLLKILNFIQFSPFSDHLPCQTLPEDTFTQEQESNSLPIENDSVSIENNPAVVDTQTVDSPVQDTTDGKKIIYLFYPSATIMN